MDHTSDDESLALSSHALAALQEFLTEKQEHEERFNALQAAAEARHEESKKEGGEGNNQEDPLFSIDLFKEDWQLSQFWRLQVSNPVLLLEYDERFAVFKQEFCSYDYREPLKPLVNNEALRHSAAVIIVDPPFLNEDCFSKTSETVRALANEHTKYIVLTGWMIRDVVQRELSVHLAEFRPEHRNGLANDFRCYVNYRSDSPAFSKSTHPDDQA
ncbi:putative N6-adenine methyltransferase-domain-containing protein [Syncephalis plumigaleata]|nr:putative N6-adenine methyltransferase-domain-containing protein [Syncephalis plumigaleata]